MIKIISALILSICTLSAQYEIIDKPNVFTVKIENETFDELYANLKSEINFQSFIIVHELNLAKSTANAEALEKTAVVKNGINILICKSSFTLQMHEENIENMTFCPMVISVYEDKKENRFISYRKYHPLKKGDKIPDEINQKLKDIILKSLD